MNLDILSFEKPLVEVEQKLAELRHLGSSADMDIAKEINKLEEQREQLVKSIFNHLTPAQVVQLARHPKRPHAIDYIDALFTDFDELHGDRHYADDHAIIAGIGRLNEQPVFVLGQERGRTTKEKLYRNFAMPRPEGYRKALRLMQMAEKFSLPILTFIDTPGAYPGIDAEEHNQSEAIAHNLLVMSRLKTPIICTVIGEGGSGGALAIGVGDRLLMLQYSMYSVISPEGCASILWRSASKAPEAAAAMKLTAQDSFQNQLIDEVIAEPAGGAHRDPTLMMDTLRNSLRHHLAELQQLSVDELLSQRYQKLMRYGA